MPCRSSLCRSGVAPPTGTIHPRKGRGAEDRKQSKDPFPCAGRGLNCAMPVDLMPVGGCTPDRNDPPTRGQRSRRQKTVKRSISLRRSEVELCHAGRPYAGRGLHPRPESSTPAKYPPTTPNPEKHPPKINLLTVFCRLFNALAWVDRSRSGVQPPTGTRPTDPTLARLTSPNFML